VLSPKHLAIVRAALKYLDDEISPHGKEALFDYLDEAGRTLDPEIEDLKTARRKLDSVELNYLLVDSTGIVVESERLIPSSTDDELSFQSDLSLLATVLVPIQPSL
jgi:hypothetical protein